MIIRKMKEGIIHQGIGGKDILIDLNISHQLNPSYIIKEARSGNIACKNFISRRRDFDVDFPFRLYYGHINGLGYIVSDDEMQK